MARVASHWPMLPGLTAGERLSLDEGLDRLHDWLESFYSAGEFNGTVLIAKDANICFERHYGFADIDDRVPLSGSASFSLASASKPFTALAILLLVQAGRLTLEDGLVQHVPEFAAYDGVTIRHLLHHLSGLPDHVQLIDQHWKENRLVTMPDLISLFVKHRPPAYFAAGTQFEFSNTGYALLGEIIARASGRTYGEFMAEAIFDPLGMKDSAAFNLSSKTCPLRFRVFGMRQHSGRRVRCDLNFLDGLFGDGGIYSSAEDLVRWDAALRAGTLLPCDVYAQAYVSGRLGNGTSTGYGFGWDVEPSNVVEHTSEWDGFAVFLRRDLKQHTLLAVLSNLGPSGEFDPICMDLAAFVEKLDWSGLAGSKGGQGIS